MLGSTEISVSKETENPIFQYNIVLYNIGCGKDTFFVFHYTLFLVSKLQVH